MARYRWLRRARGVRVQSALAATLVVAIAMALAGSALVLLQRRQLTGGLESVARQQARDIVHQITTGGLDSVDVRAVSAVTSESALVQVVDPSGSVVAATPSAEEESLVSSALPAPGEVVVERLARLPIGDDAEPFVVVTAGVAAGGGTARVVTAQSLEGVDRSTAVVLTLLAVGYPLMLVVVAATSYWFAGRALAPVEDLRRRVGSVSATDLAARVPVPDSGDEIARLAGTMNVMLSRLQDSAAAQRRFVADASHELRSPLATIRAATELAAAQSGGRQTDETVLAETARLERLVSDLLLLARSDEHGLVLQAHDVDLDDVVAEEGARMRQVGALDVRVDVRAVRVHGDLQHLVRAVRNLSDNASQFAASTVTLRLRTDGDVARVEVDDDGPGIPAAERERVFERFVRLDSSRARGTGGTGLGLAIARQIARVHGGDLVVADRADGHSGTRMVLTVPLPAPERSLVLSGQPPSAARR